LNSIFSTLRRYHRPLAWTVALVTLAFLARILLDSRAELQRYPISIEPRALALSFGALVLTLWLAVPVWHVSLRWLGARLTLWQATRIWFLSNAVRYVPGNIWQPLTMVVLAKERGIDEVRTATSVALNWVLSNLSGLLVAGLTFAVDTDSPSRERLWLLPLVAVAALGALHPAVLGRLLRLAQRAASSGESVQALSFPRLLALLLMHCGVWLCYGVSFAIFWSALDPLDWRELPRLTGVFAGAYAIGFLSLLTPSGLGVREGALVYLLSGAHPAAVVTVVALLSRLWLIAGEMVWTGIVLLLTRGKHA
jgi:uncharacterized membrane protein YbhN (UPF0104 family)